MRQKTDFSDDGKGGKTIWWCSAFCILSFSIEGLASKRRRGLLDKLLNENDFLFNCKQFFFFISHACFKMVHCILAICHSALTSSIFIFFRSISCLDMNQNDCILWKALEH